MHLQYVQRITYYKHFCWYYVSYNYMSLPAAWKRGVYVCVEQNFYLFLWVWHVF
jgi:hypothetical protein